MIILLFFICAETVSAQWSSKDSLWLVEVLSDKKEIQLKPEVIRAIESGDLINFENDENKLITAPEQMPLSKDFKQYIQHTGIEFEKIDHTTMLPGVFMLYFKPPVIEFGELKSFSLKGIEKYTPNRPQPMLSTDPLAKGQASGEAIFMICLNDVINYYILKNRY